MCACICVCGLGRRESGGTKRKDLVCVYVRERKSERGRVRGREGGEGRGGEGRGGEGREGRLRANSYIFPGQLLQLSSSYLVHDECDADLRMVQLLGIAGHQSSRHSTLTPLGSNGENASST